MQTIHKIYANWDDEAAVWIAESDDVPGLVAEADTLDLLHVKLAALVPELLLANAAATDGIEDTHYELVTEAGPFCTTSSDVAAGTIWEENQIPG